MKCLYFCVILISLVCFFLDWAWVVVFCISVQLVQNGNCLAVCHEC